MCCPLLSVTCYEEQLWCRCRSDGGQMERKSYMVSHTNGICREGGSTDKREAQVEEELV
jgi:hypothetical protein